MSGNVSPNLTSLNAWIDEQYSPRVIYAPCECLCHSRKISMLMLENIDKQNTTLLESVYRIDIAVNSLMKLMEDLDKKKN